MRVALVGLGVMGRRHVQAIDRFRDLELVGVCDREEAALALGPAGVPRFEDPRRLLEEGRPDLLIVATHAPSHHDLVLAGLRAGVRRILCEKPIACSVAEAEAMVSEANRLGALLAVNHSRRHVPAYRWLAAAMRSGSWGALRSIRSSCPGIGLGCLATHFIDLACFLAGEPIVSVSGWIDEERGVNRRGADFHDPGGLVVATLQSGARVIHEQIEDAVELAPIVLDFTLGQVSIDERTESFRISTGASEVATRDSGPPDDHPFRLDMVELTSAVLHELATGGPLTCGAEHGRHALEVVVAAHLSDGREHATVALPLSDQASRSLWLPIT
jgi:predicted dehydrogenase